MVDTLVPVILCGGQGTRLWPVSRRAFPKQFVAIDSELSTFQETVARVSNPDVFATPVVVASNEHRFIVQRQLSALGSAAPILLEPDQRH
jgi:mannose-1-phosphate guanylyltransferase